MKWIERLMRALGPLAMLACVSTCVHAGGVIVDRKSVELTKSGPLSPGEAFELKFNALQYTYGSDEYLYLLVAVVPASRKLPLKAADLGRATVFGLPLASPDVPPDLPSTAAPIQLALEAPQAPGRYRVMISQIPVFRPRPMAGGIALKRPFTPTAAERAAFIRDGSNALGEVTTFSVSSAGPSTPPPDLRLYLRLNGKVPTQVLTEGGLAEAPLAFSWALGDEVTMDRSRLLFRYQLSPEDEAWGAWTPERSANYLFLPRGVHQFRVQAKYAAGSGDVLSQPASYQFNLPKDFISRPTKAALTKSLDVVATDRPKIAFGEVYASSRALLVGMWEFDSPNFPRFDGSQISADLAAMEKALKANGFEVTTLKRGKVRREEIADALATLVERSGKDDRLLVYFSTHGFVDPLSTSEAYLATSDCDPARPTHRCFRLNELQDQATRALDGKKVRQVLFAIDSCFAGLGVVRKAGGGAADLTKLAIPQGAFMLTAGMADQTAQIDPGLGMSTFTHFLAEGLGGKADILGNNGIITLTELFVYVQYEVARRTQSNQIPMMGRMKGDGEMLFAPGQAK